MLKLLLRLWWLQQRRNFRKRDAFVACYIIFLYVMVGVGFYQGFTESGGELKGEEMPALLGAGIVIGMLIPDIIIGCNDPPAERRGAPLAPVLHRCGARAGHVGPDALF